MESLYIQPVVSSFEKNASEVTLPENANLWPNEIMQELFKQVPYIADFEPQVVMDRVDAERGYAFGHVEVQNKTELQGNADPAAMKAVGIQQVRIPVVVKDRKLQPFDVAITADSKAIPLNEGRMRQALFRPQAFDVTSRTPGDMSMVGQLYPPQRQNYGGGGGGGSGMSVGMGKEGSALESFLSKEAAANIPSSTLSSPAGPTVRDLIPKKVKLSSIMQAILPTISASDYNRFAHDLEEPSLQAAFMKNAAATAPTLQYLSHFEPSSVEKTAAALEHLLRPDVVQITKVAQGYRVKTARHDYWQPTSQEVDRGAVVRAYGAKVAMAADETGSVTLAEGDGVKEDEGPEAKPELVSSFGVYRVKEESGQELVGFVFPNLLDLDGTALPICLFTNGSVTGMQESIAGESVGKDQGLVFGPQKGHGMFVQRLKNGGVNAMIPMTIKGGYAEGGSQKMSVETYDGREVFVEVQPNIQSPTETDGCVLIPQDFQWMPLGGGETSLVVHPEQWGQSKAASRSYASVVLRAGGPNTFSVSGYPLEKLAEGSMLPSLQNNTLDDVLFLLAGLGTDLTYASEKIAQAVAFHEPVEVRVGRHIKTAGEAQMDSLKTASAWVGRMPNVRRSLLKEAAFIPDPLAVDTVLSVGFINPENIMTFVSYLPQMDVVQGKLCELLIAARLGLQDVPVSPLEKAIKSLEEVIEGLKILAFQKS